MKLLNTIIRTHVKNELRLQVLERTILSWYDKELYSLGDLFIVDDQSPLEREIINLIENINNKKLPGNPITYFRTQGQGDTKNGLYWSLKVQENYPVLCCVDDMVFGKGIKERLIHLIDNELLLIGENYGMIGTFACYEQATRNPNRYNKEDLWIVPIDIFYATVCHVFSEKLSKIIIKEWEEIQQELKPIPNCCDDIWVKEICRKEKLKIYNTLKADYAQHTGANLRTFNEDTTGSSEYYSKLFIGE